MYIGVIRIFLRGEINNLRYPIPIPLGKKLIVTVIPPINSLKYLQYLYTEILNQSNERMNNLYLFSPPIRLSKITSKFLDLFNILFLLLKTRSTTGTILHIHWIEFLYLWGNHKYLTPILIPIQIGFFRVFKKISKNKIVLTVHNLRSHNIHWFLLEHVFFKIMLQEISDCVFVHSSLQKELLVKLYSVNREKVFVIQHGFFKTPKLSNPLNHKQSRAKIGISQNDVVFSFIGAISEYKGVTVLLEAMKELFDKGTKMNIKLIIAGKADNTYLHFLLKKYRRILNDKRVFFINKRLSEDELETVLNAADFGICPYVNATTPATLLDFISHNLPIVTTDDINALNLIREYPALIAKRGDYPSLAQAITCAYVNLSEYKKRVKNFKDMSSFDKGWRASASITLDCYLNLTKT